MHQYRTHNCNELRIDNAGAPARLSGWVHRKRDHGNLLFVDLRDHFGITQCVVDVSSAISEQFPYVWTLPVQMSSLRTVEGRRAARTY